MLRVSQVPPGDPSTAAFEGRSRLECLTCPYQHILTKQLFERKEIMPKQPDDALGGEGAWDNVDKTNGMLEDCEGDNGSEADLAQCNAPTISAGTSRRIGTSCRFAPLMSL